MRLTVVGAELASSTARSATANLVKAEQSLAKVNATVARFGAIASEAERALSSLATQLETGG